MFGGGFGAPGEMFEVVALEDQAALEGGFGGPGGLWGIRFWRSGFGVERFPRNREVW